MRKKRTSNALKGIASCMICAWSLCACGNVAEDSSDRKVMEESKAAEYEALFDEIKSVNLEDKIITIKVNSPLVKHDFQMRKSFFLKKFQEKFGENQFNDLQIL